MKAFLATATAATALAAGCSTTPPPRAPAHAVTPQAASLTTRQACQRLRADAIRDKGTADLPALRYIADRVTAIPRLAMDARDAVKDIGHTGIAPVPLALLKDDCALAGVDIPVP